MIASRPRPHFPGRHRQRGAAAIFAAIAIVAMVSSMALAIDVGRLYFAQRDLQRLANIAALDAVRVVSGCAANGLQGTQSEVALEVQTSLTRNRSADDGVSITAVTEVGRQMPDTAGALRQFLPLNAGNTNQDAVRVRLTRPSPGRLLPALTGSPQSNLTAVAVARQPAVGGFHVGSGLLTLNTAQSALLNPLLESLLCPMGGASCRAGINLSAADYSGLVGAQLSLGDLLAGATDLGLNVQDVSDLLDVELTLPQWLGVVGQGLNGALDVTGNQVSGGVAGLVQGLAGVAESDGTTFGLPALLAGLGTGLNEPVGEVVSALPFVDAMSLVQALGMAATRQPDGSYRPIAINDLGLSIPGVATVGVFLQVGQPPQFGLGPAGSEEAVARTAQVTLKARISAGQLLTGLVTTINNTINTLLGLVGALLNIQPTVTVASSLNLGIDVAVAPAAARLEELQCPRSGFNDGMPVASFSGSTGVATATVGTFTGAATGQSAVIPNSSIPLARVAINASSACVGLNALGLCLGLPVNLGTSTVDLALGLQADVGGAANSFALDDVTRFTGPGQATSDDFPYRYLAVNPVAANPQERGSSVTVDLGLSLVSNQTGGTGLTGALVGLVGDLVNRLTSTVLNLLMALVNNVLGPVLDNLLQLLGISLGKMTFTMGGVGVEQPHLINLSEAEQ